VRLRLITILDPAEIGEGDAYFIVVTKATLTIRSLKIEGFCHIWQSSRPRIL